MCRAATCDGGRRCLAHSPEARAVTRAEGTWDRIAGKVKSYIEDLGEKLAAGGEDIPVYSRWRLMWHKLAKKTTAAVEALVASREALRKVRAERAAERLAALRDDERRAKAAEAVAEVERRITEAEEAADGLRAAQDDEVRTRVHEDWPTPKGMAGDLWLDAISERAEWEMKFQKADVKLRPADALPDPKTGQSTKAKEQWRYAKMKLDFSLRHEARMKEAFETIPTHDEAVEALAQAEIRDEAAREDLAKAKKIQDALLNTGRPVTAVAKVAA